MAFRSLRKYQTQDSAVAKLFAKHIKLPEAIEYVKRTRYVEFIVISGRRGCLLTIGRIGIGIGTPQRIVGLLECKALKSRALKRIVIDGSHLDQKKRAIFDMKELLGPLVKLSSTYAVQTGPNPVEDEGVLLVF